MRRPKRKRFVEGHNRYKRSSVIEFGFYDVLFIYLKHPPKASFPFRKSESKSHGESRKTSGIVIRVGDPVSVPIVNPQFAAGLHASNNAQ